MKGKKLERLLLTVVYHDREWRVNMGPLFGPLNFVATAKVVHLPAGRWRRLPWLQVFFLPPYSTWLPGLVSSFHEGAEPWFEGRWLRPTTYEVNSLLLGLNPRTPVHDYAAVLKKEVAALFHSHMILQREITEVSPQLADTFKDMELWNAHE